LELKLALLSEPLSLELKVSLLQLEASLVK
jgi:hypothetical protein